MVLSGTVAERLGVETGKAYLIQCREVESDPKYGRQFRHTKFGENITALDLATKDFSSLGDAGVIDVSERVEDASKDKSADAVPEVSAEAEEQDMPF